MSAESQQEPQTEAKTNARQKRKRTEKPTASGTCFVLLPFREPFNRYYEKIYRPAIEAEGLKPERADSLFRSSMIIGDIWSMVKRAKVLLADLTGRSANVFYELGLAHAIGKPVVLIANDVEYVPFDLRGLRVLIYDKDHESWGTKLTREIRRSLRETLEDVKSAVPATFIEPNQGIVRPREDAIDREIRDLKSELRGIRNSFGIPSRTVADPLIHDIVIAPIPWEEKKKRLEEYLTRGSYQTARGVDRLVEQLRTVELGKK